MPAPTQIGRRGGRFYITKSGHRVYVRAMTRPKRRVMREGVLRPTGAAGSQLPKATLDKLKAVGVSKLPASHIKDVLVSKDLGTPAQHKGALLIWKDDKGREQKGYSAEHDRAAAEKKWARVQANRPRIENAMGALQQAAMKDPASAAVLVMAQTSLRPGSPLSVLDKHYGVTTMLAKHVGFSGDGAHIEYVGKQGKVNVADVTDPKTVAALRVHAAGKRPNERLFDTTKEAVRAAAPPGVKLKDFRTVGATKHAEQLLSKVTPVLTGDDRRDARVVVKLLHGVSTEVGNRLNNTPAMARARYIHPQVIRAWGERHKLPAKWLG